jgi:hypothetical protein
MNGVELAFVARQHPERPPHCLPTEAIGDALGGPMSDIALRATEPASMPVGQAFSTAKCRASGTERGSPRLLRASSKGVHHMIKTLGCACALVIGAGLTSATAAEREQVRMVINLISGVKMPYPENLRNIVAHTERVYLDTNGATVACLRLDDKVRWCYEHIAPVGNRAEMLRIRKEPVPGLEVGQSYQYVDDLDLDGTIDIGSTTTLEGEPYAPLGRVSQFFYRAAGRGDKFRGDFQALYDEGIQVALKYLGE